MTNPTTDRLVDVLDWTTKHCPNAMYVPIPRELFAAIQSQQAEIDTMKTAIAWANNSLFGSQGFFLSLNGGPPNEHHLDMAIEDLKSRANKAWKRAEAQQAEITDLTQTLDGVRKMYFAAEKREALLEAEIERLREALGPFADIPIDGSNTPDGYRDNRDWRDHLRNACAALNPQPGKESGK